ncbi:MULTISPECIES: methyltransferase domain-containing protein [Caproicibacterium]|uniref:Methyltransferase domain-containing protein n=1 Tax=Caproicibacterium argilliputei TaxID=3030016 RepID=A0AA97DD28_9FIRM|nr:methyltransferase domain-containing protein [Caproicibacterium argilliputei]WOC33295.1 methyltransferase domain-containing protein [Caproicibacterium argilliputei]
MCELEKWNSTQYLKFQAERTQPSIDLVKRLSVENPKRIVDIGCGPGNSTAVLQQKYPQAEIIGVDSSPEMLATAAKAHPELSFQLCDVGADLSALGGGFDIVFSNACIQWVPDHSKLLKNLLGLLRSGGVLAVQIPVNQGEPIHQIIMHLVGSAKWKPKFRHPRIFYTLSAEAYFDILASCAADFTMWQTTYFHRMQSHEAILEWYRGTGLRPYLCELPEAEQVELESEVLAQVRKAYPVQQNGEVIFRFPRLFFTAVR